MRRVDHPRFIAALRQVEDSIDAAWDSFCAESGVPTGTAEARELARTGYELFLPDLLDGTLPTTPEAQRLKRLINQLADDDLEHLLTPADLHRKEV